MSTPLLRTRLETIIALARLLERVESGHVRTLAEPYRQLVKQLQAALSAELPADALHAILRAYPAASELYENLHYQHAGLSRAPLEQSAASEVEARQLLARVASQAKR